MNIEQISKEFHFKTRDNDYKVCVGCGMSSSKPIDQSCTRCGGTDFFSNENQPPKFN